MADPHVVSALRAKRDELDRTIVAYESALAAAKRDFVSVNATLALFENDRSSADYPSRLSIARMFAPRELFELCEIALADAPQGLDTRELAQAIIVAKRLDEADGVLRKAIGYRIARTMLRQAKRGKVRTAGKSRGARVWEAS
jgi:hypothetical protein